MFDIKIKTIPAHIAYHTEYDINDYMDFFDEKSGENALQVLADKVERENTNLRVPPIPGDYNYFTHEAGAPVVFPAHVGYYDMVTDFGVDTDEYAFVRVPEVTAAVVPYKGALRNIGCAYEFAYGWIRENGYEIAGDGRSSAIHGPWDRDNEEEYLTEVQIPVKKKQGERDR